MQQTFSILGWKHVENKENSCNADKQDRGCSERPQNEGSSFAIDPYIGFKRIQNPYMKAEKDEPN